MKSIGLLGCGNIASIVAREMPDLRCVAVYDLELSQARKLAEMTGARACASFLEFNQCDIDLVLEAASVDAVSLHAADILTAGRDLIVLSAGAFLAPGFKESMSALARENGAHIRIASGAVFGLDNLKVGGLSAIDELTLRTTKPPRALGCAVSERSCLFQGSVWEAVKLYPKNINVAAALALASGKEVQVEMWADPAASLNTHEVLARGRFGELQMRIANYPSPDNPRTSYLAALSVMSLLSREDDVFVVGN